MSVVTFWGSGKEQVGKTMAVVALATNMAIEHNKKILVISASYNNDTLKNCYWSTGIAKKTNMFIKNPGVELGNGIEGLAKMVQSNKITPETITDYTKIVFKDRLEVLLGFEERTSASGENIAKIYSEIVQVASRYYDFIFVDLDNEIDTIETEEILQKSNLIIAMASQKLSSISTMKEKMKKFPENKTMLLIGKFDKQSKYNLKNLSRTFGEKKEFLAIPYSTLYFESAQEGNVADLFLKLRRIEDKMDENWFFIEQVKTVSSEIMKKLHDQKIIK